MGGNYVRQNFTLPADILAKLRKLAACDFRPMSNYLARMIEATPIPEQCGEMWAENGHQIGQPAVRKSEAPRKKGKK